MKKTILIIDTACRSPYTGHTLRDQGMGGSESSVVRVAEQLATDSKFNIIVHIHNIEKDAEVNGVLYTNGKPEQADYVISLRNPMILQSLRQQYKKAKLFMWCTDLFDNIYASYRDTFYQTNTTLIAVSDYHRNQIIQQFLTNTSTMAPVKIVVIHNIVDLEKINVPVDKNKLIFTSTYIKGLKTTLESFKKITDNSVLKDMKLYLANPGYLPELDTKEYKNVISLGSLKPSELYKEVASSLCLFTTNRTFPETFGLVFAEANALGTPFIAHPLGAVRELYKGSFQLMDTYDVKNLIMTLAAWQEKRPEVSAHEQFRVTNVIPKWYDVLGVNHE